jgi:hypothetical protein
MTRKTCVPYNINKGRSAWEMVLTTNRLSYGAW